MHVKAIKIHMDLKMWQFYFRLAVKLVLRME